MRRTIQRHHAIGIIHFEIFVMQVVGKVGSVQTRFLANHHPVEFSCPNPESSMANSRY